ELKYYTYTQYPLHLYTQYSLPPYVFTSIPYTFIPLYLYTFIPIHLYTYIPIYLYTYIPISPSTPHAHKIKIGLLSDTHGYLDPKVFDYFGACDEIWHVGDIGSSEVATALENFKPIKAVYGNIDDRVLRAKYPEDL